MIREEAVKELKYIKESFAVNEFSDEAMDMAIEALQEQKTGKWIHGVYTSGTEYRRCINCFAEIEEVFFGFEYAVNYCPHCGAKMEA